MSFLGALYTLLIKPLELLFEIIFSIANRILPNPGLAIIALSLSMNFLVLPLYKRADAMQEEERRAEEKIGPWQEKIKKTFKGDERFMMLQAFYRENNYKPTDALKGSLSLLLEIPFFIAAYRMLSSLKLLHGVKFGPIADLGTPDRMIVIGAFAVNLLPILMTLINIVSSAIYTKGLPMKSKVQLYGVALIFLVFLYNSPAGLVFYWTLNNLFSLVKNIFYKIKQPGKVLGILVALSGVAVNVMTFVKRHDFYSQRLVRLFLFGTALILIPFIVLLVKRAGNRFKGKFSVKEGKGSLFVTSMIFITVLTGVLIPSSVISSSVPEFVISSDVFNPVRYLWYSGLTAAGFFLVWAGILYYLMSRKGKAVFALAGAGLVATFIVNYMLFDKDLGTLSADLKFDVKPEYAFSEQLINLLAIGAVFALVVFLGEKFPRICGTVILAGCLAVSGMAIKNIASINREYKSLDYINAQTDIPNFTVSTEGRNVVVLMIDRALGAQIPYIMNEKPELMETFDGFTYYPNTVSFGGYTNFGTPALFGGYEYTPENMNARDTEPLAVKHDEAIKVMPYIFDDNGFDVTVCDPSYAGYKWTPDLSVYDERPDIHTYITNDKFNDLSDVLSGGRITLLERNLFLYGIFKVAPLAFQGNIYNVGAYNGADLSSHVISSQTIENRSEASGYNYLFVNAFSVLDCLPKMTTVEQGSGDNFLILTNDTTHEPALLQEPEYLPAAYVDNTPYDGDIDSRYVIDGRRMNMDSVLQVTHYDVNMASLIQIGEWLDFLRENGCYDNTRIIIVSDHGRDIAQFDDMVFFDGDLDVEMFNPVLLVKDFDSEGFTVDDTFMTNGDVPTLAFDGIVEDPVNPFTGNIISSDAKNDGDINILVSEKWSIDENNGNVFLPDEWYSIQGNIFEEENWTYLGVSDSPVT